MKKLLYVFCGCVFLAATPVSAQVVKQAGKMVVSGGVKSTVKNAVHTPRVPTVSVKPTVPAIQTQVQRAVVPSMQTQVRTLELTQPSITPAGTLSVRAADVAPSLPTQAAFGGPRPPVTPPTVLIAEGPDFPQGNNFGKPIFPQKKDLATLWDIQSLPREQAQIHRALRNISDNAQKALENTALTPEQFFRVSNAVSYFRSLSPKQASDVDVMMSAPFRQHAAVLRSPQATEYAYYLQGNRFREDYENAYKYHRGLEDENGYIPTVIGDPTTGVSLEEIHRAFAAAEPTDKPIFVNVAMHGGVRDNHFRMGANASTRLSTLELVQELQFLRQTTHTPEVNLQLDSCHSGACVTDFEQLPAQLREGINIFATSGNFQYSYSDGSSYAARSRGTEKTIVLHQVGLMLESIQNTNISVRANIDGQPFNPLKTAAEDPTLNEYYHLLYRSLYEELQHTNNPLSAEELKDNIEAELEPKHTMPLFSIARQMGEQRWGEDFIQMFEAGNFIFR